MSPGGLFLAKGAVAKIQRTAKLGPLRSLGVSPTGVPATPEPGVSPPRENLPFETLQIYTTQSTYQLSQFYIILW